MIEFEFKKNLLIIQGNGEVTQEQANSEALRLAGHPLYDPFYNIMIDLRQMGSTDMDAAGLRAILNKELEMGYNRKVAIVASKDLLYGMARMYQSMAADLKSDYRVFRDYFNGLAWLLQRKKYSESELQHMRRTK